MGKRGQTGELSVMLSRGPCNCLDLRSEGEGIGKADTQHSSLGNWGTDTGDVHWTGNPREVRLGHRLS